MKNFKKIKKGFTLAELLLSISIIIIVVGLTIPVARKALPDADREKAKFAYYQIANVIKSMVTDPYLYPTGRFDKPKDYNNPQTGVEYIAPEKFAKAFASKLNVLEAMDLGSRKDWKTGEDKVVYGDYDDAARWNRFFGFEDMDMGKQREITIAGTEYSYVRKCILTSNKIYYCLPLKTYLYEGEGYNGDYDRFSGDSSVIVKVYLTEDHSIEKGYYFAVNKDGKISLVPADTISNIITKNKNSTPSFCSKATVTCADKCMYDNVNHCKLYEYLSRTNKKLDDTNYNKESE